MDHRSLTDEQYKWLCNVGLDITFLNGYVSNDFKNNIRSIIINRMYNLQEDRNNLLTLRELWIQYKRLEVKQEEI